MNQFEEIKDQVSKKKKIFASLALGVLVLAIPFGVRLIQQQQELRSMAGGETPIEFVKDKNVTCDAQGNCTTTSQTVQVNLRSRLGPQPTTTP